MTTPADRPTGTGQDVRERLDELERLREAATPGPWRVNPNEAQELLCSGGAVAEAWETADAALIVAAVNAFGPLVQAVREFAELEADYPLGSDVPVYRIGRVLVRLESALGAPSGRAHSGEGRGEG